MTKRDLPAPFYAAAGAGDLAYQRLRRLPEVAERTLKVAEQTATTLRERVTVGEARLNRDRIAADLAKLRESAQKRAETVVASAAQAQQRAVTGYRTLVKHGEQVMAARDGTTTWATASPEIGAAAAAEPTAGTPAAGTPATAEPATPKPATARPAAPRSTATMPHKRSTT